MVQSISSLLPSLHHQQHHCCTSYGAPPHSTQRPILIILILVLIIIVISVISIIIVSLKPPLTLSPMAQEPSHPSHQEKQGGKERGGGGGGDGDDNTRSSSSSSNNNNNNRHGKSNWLQLGLGTPSISVHEQQYSERQKITELQLFTGPFPAPHPGQQHAPGPATHIARPLQVPALNRPAAQPFPFFSSPGTSRPAADEAGPSASDHAGPSSTSSATARVVILPPRPQTGIWFALRASRNQRKEPWLPQISRSFIRIRDGRMTISMVMKYLVNRLGLEHESQVEITCKGQRLHPAMTLEQVRDNIWCSREAGPSIPSPSSTVANHLMTLEYGRSA